jgi:hypothetical protein
LLRACWTASRRGVPLPGVLLYGCFVSLASLVLFTRSVLSPRMLSLSTKLFFYLSGFVSTTSSPQGP